MRKTSLLCGVLAACLSTAATAQSPIPEHRVPGFGGADARPSNMSPGATGSSVGSNVGAGASASPVNNDPVPAGQIPTGPETAEAPKPLIGLSRELPPPPPPQR